MGSWDRSRRRVSGAFSWAGGGPTEAFQLTFPVVGSWPRDHSPCDTDGAEAPSVFTAGEAATGLDTRVVLSNTGGGFLPPRDEKPRQRALCDVALRESGELFLGDKPERQVVELRILARLHRERVVGAVLAW